MAEKELFGNSEQLDDTISRQAAIDAFDGVKVDEENCTEYDIGYNDGIDFAVSRLSVLPSAQPDLQECEKCIFKPFKQFQPERKKGKWTEKHHAYSDEESVIEEWQSCRCSECGRYDTRPYMYYFTEPNYCSWCGAKMKGEEHEL